jgi:predicted SAM-dependent methyltransferase
MNLRKLLRHSHIYAGFEDELKRVHVWLLRIKAGIVIRRYLSGTNTSANTRKLQIGAGPTQTDEWLTTDILAKLRKKTVYLDATARFPIPDAAMDYVFSEHMIEHIPYLAGRHMLAECMRVLKPGGAIRLATPDLRRMMALMGDDADKTMREYVAWSAGKFLEDGTPNTAIHVLNNQFRNYGHQFLYDEECLRDAMIKAGFVDIRRYKMGESDDTALRGVEKHGANVSNEAMMTFETLVLEARKPLT